MAGIARFVVRLFAVGSLCTVAACGGSDAETVTSPTPSPSPAPPPSSVSARWVGSPPEGIVFVDSSVCRYDATFDLTQNGSAVTGAFQATVRSTGCTTVTLASVDQTSGLTSPSRVTGTVADGTLSLTVLLLRSEAGVPRQVAAMFVSGPFGASPLVLSGNLTGSRAWSDAANPNGIPDCSLTTDAGNGECGPVQGAPKGVSITVRPQ